MRAEAKRSFLDLAEGVERKEGEAFELTPERFAEINRKLNGYIVETDAPATAAEPEAAADGKPKRRAASTRARKPANK